MILVDLERVSARRPDRVLFEDLSVTIGSGDRLGVVGRNGSGKSTLLRLLAGESAPEDGVVRLGRSTRVGFLDQRTTLPAGTVGQAVGSGWEAAAILDRVGMGHQAGADVATLSGGQAKRVALACVLVHEVDLLVLDEPTNHLDLDAVAWLEDRLAAFRGGLVLVTHDRHVLDRVTTRMLELDGGNGHIHDGGYAAYLAARSERDEREARVESSRRNLARAELAWLRRGAPARTRKPKARIAATTATLQGPAPVQDRPTSLDLSAAGRGASSPRLGDRVIILDAVGHRFDGHDWLFGNLELDLGPDARLGVVGPNGSGKSTLLDILARRVEPAAGCVRTGPTVRLGYYRQVEDELDAGQRVRDAVAGPAGQPNWEQVRLMERFWFDTDAQWAPIGTLSGGERRRLQLLLVLAKLPNVLLLDEPTNDLDLDTLRALEDHLEAWPGALVVVSHDRALLERTIDDVLVLDGNGGSAMAPGGYAGYQAERARPRAKLEATQSAGPPGGRLPRPGLSTSAQTTAARGVKVAKPRSASTLRRLIEQAERDMAEVTRTRDRLAAQLAAAGSDHVATAAAAHELAEAEARLVAAENRWIGLSEELGA
ncbi:MAG: ABC-F family ATP-binding cassette domain-containing protein [Acidimicrobiales bacterium]